MVLGHSTSTLTNSVGNSLALGWDDGSTSFLFRKGGDSYLNGGQVGINYTTPAATLHVKGEGSTTGTDAFRVQNSSDSETLALDDVGNLDVAGFVDTGDDFRKAGITILDVELGTNGNIVFGQSAMNIDTISGAIRNTAIGYDAGSSITNGDSNTMIGYGAGRLLDTESNNVAIGSLAMCSHTGQQSVAIGVGALDAAGTGSGNIAIGYNSISALVGTANDNIAIGRNTMLAATGGTYNITIGNQAGPSSGAGLIGTISFGRQAIPTANYQALIGGNLGGINEVYFGRGVERVGSGGAVSTTLTTTGVQAGDTDGNANNTLYIAGALGTGSGNGGDIIMQVSPPGTSGSAQNPLVDLLTLDGTDNLVVVGDVTSPSFKLNVEDNVQITSTGLAELSVSSSAGVAVATIQTTTSGNDPSVRFRAADGGFATKATMGWDSSISRFRMGTTSVDAGVFFEHLPGNGTRTVSSFAVGTALPGSTARFLVTGAGSTSATNAMLVQNSSSNELMSIDDAGNVVFNEGGLDADFRVEGDTEPNLFWIDASNNNINISAAGAATTKIHVDTINESSKADGIILNLTTNVSRVGAQATVNNGTNASIVGFFGQASGTFTNATSRGIWGDSIGGSGTYNYGVYGRAGNGSAQNVGVYGIDSFGDSGATLSAGVYGFGQGESPTVHGVYGATSGGNAAFTNDFRALRAVAGGGIDDVSYYGVHSHVSLGGGITGATGYGLYVQYSNNVSAGNNMYGVAVQDSRDYLGFGTATPSVTLEVANGQFVVTQNDETISSNAATIDFDDSNNAQIDLQSATAGVTVTITGGTAGGWYTVSIIQGSTDRAVSWSGNTSILWPNGIEPSQSTGNDVVDVYRFYHNGSNFIGNQDIRAAQ